MIRYHFDTEVYRMLAKFYAISGLRIGIHDLRTLTLIEYPRTSLEYSGLIFCDKIWRLCHEFEEACHACDRHALEHVMESKEPLIYTCHAGFTEALIPVVMNDEIICVFFIGQIRNNRTSRQTLEQILDRVRKCGTVLNAETVADLGKSFEELPRIEPDRLDALVYFLQICARNILKEHLITWTHRPLSERFAEYVDINLYNPITIHSTAEALGCSVSHLSRVIAADLHSTFSEYLNEHRVEVAKMLLQSTRMTVKAVALTLTYEEPTYFMHIFKKYTGMSCTEYRKNFGRGGEYPIFFRHGKMKKYTFVFGSGRGYGRFFVCENAQKMFFAVVNSVSAHK